MAKNGVSITNREIFDELRQVHSKVDLLGQKFGDHVRESDEGYARLSKVESRLQKLREQTIKHGLLIALVVTAGSFLVQWAFGKLLG